MQPDAPFDVRVEGSGSPMVLIAGAACDDAVWAGVVRHLGSRYALHLLKLAGFAGQPPIAVPLLAATREGLAAYLRRPRLHGAVVVGHSLGAFLAYAAAVDAPDAVAAVVAIDGVPALGPLLCPGGSSVEIEREAARRRDRLVALGPAGFKQYLARTFESMVAQPVQIADVVARAVRSDPQVVAAAMHELWTADLRPELARLRAPTLLVAPGWPDLQPSLRRYWLESYREQLAAIAGHRLVQIDGARHFIMQDAPEALTEQMDRFLSGCR